MIGDFYMIGMRGGFERVENKSRVAKCEKAARVDIMVKARV